MKNILYIMIILCAISCGKTGIKGYSNENEARMDMMDGELKGLYDEFINEGFSQFFIEGVGGPTSDDVEILGFNDGTWEICYVERGQKQKPIFSSADKKEAVECYRKHVYRIRHHHLASFTRSKEKTEKIKLLLSDNNIVYWQNDIPNYSQVGDTVYRLFVFNKDIFKIREMDKSLAWIEQLQ